MSEFDCLKNLFFNFCFKLWLAKSCALARIKWYSILYVLVSHNSIRNKMHFKLFLEKRILFIFFFIELWVFFSKQGF